jgi:hypothetical protein
VLKETRLANVITVVNHSIVEEADANLEQTLILN